MLVEIILGAFAGEATGLGVTAATKIWQKKEAKKELAECCASAIEEALSACPALAEDLRSESFVVQVLVPAVKASISDPSQMPENATLAGEYLNMFVAQFARDGDVDGTLERIFQADRAQLCRFFAQFFKSLKSKLYRSKHWRIDASLQTLESVSQSTGRLEQMLAAAQFEAAKRPISLEKATEDAFEGSSDLREWPKDIFGERIVRPAFERVLRHIESNRSGTSLIIGEAGSGKSALMAELTVQLEKSGTPVFAIKADMLSESSTTLADLERDLGLEGNLVEEIAVISDAMPTVVLIDQLDAVSEVMDQSANRMRLLVRLVRKIRNLRLGTDKAPVHIVVSSRPFEAAHDARFQQLKPDDEFQLELPSWTEVSELLGRLAIDPKTVNPGLQETLRRPFALKLYVEIVRRGQAVEDLEASQLLDRWLSSCDLGDAGDRGRSIDLMVSLATDMIADEALWRPADKYEARQLDALRRCESNGLIVRQGPNIGFSHQSWLDDFQAKSFSNGSDLAEYVWQKQDSLFVRATVLRSLQRLRWVDIEKYKVALDALLSSDQTRRHIRHLLADILAINTTPEAIEVSWVQRFITDDSVLARRSLSKLVKNWYGWREHLNEHLPGLMADEQFRWISASMLSAELSHDADFVMNLIEQHWDAPEFDFTVFNLFEQAEILTDRIRSHIEKMFKRSQIDDHGVSHFIKQLCAQSRFDEAAAILDLWVRQQQVDRHRVNTLYDLHKFAENSPEAVADVLLPWFIELAQSGTTQRHGTINQYEYADVFPWDWDDPVNQDNPFAVLERALKKMADENPRAVWERLRPLLEIEIEQIQELIAGTLVAAGKGLWEESFSFLMVDDRRLHIGNPTVSLRQGVIGSAPGLVSQELVGAIAPLLTDDRLEELREKIEAWERYSPEELEDLDARGKRDRRRWTEDSRKELLDRFPPDKLPPRRRRQVQEWRKKNPRHQGRSRNHMASMVGSPMDHEQMGKASDDAIMGMLEKINDQSPGGDRLGYSVSRSGGNVEVSRAFGAFGKTYPDRAISIAETRLEPGKHEYAAGELVDELSGRNQKVEDLDPTIAPRLFELIALLTEKGFNSEEWRQHASSALSRIAWQLKGLPDETIALLESWLQREPALIAKQIQHRLAFEERNQRSNKADDEPKQSIIFDHGFGSMRILPHHNFTILSAIRDGLLARPEPDFDGWSTALLQHLPRAEDPAIWQALLTFRGRDLYWADRDQVHELFRQLWQLDASIFDTVDLIGELWPIRAAIPDDLLSELLDIWLQSSDPKTVQCAAEFVMAGHLADPEVEILKPIADSLAERGGRAHLGRLFATSAAWSADSYGIRKRAHAVLMEAIPDAVDEAAVAVARSVDRRRRLVPDALTKELLSAILANDAVFSEALGYNFLEGMESLLVHSEFDELLLQICDKAAEPETGGTSDRSDRMLGKELVQVCIALMRNDSAIRKRAMDIYETLLDLGTFGAEDAAKAAIGR